MYCKTKVHDRNGGSYRRMNEVGKGSPVGPRVVCFFWCYLRESSLKDKVRIPFDKYGATQWKKPRLKGLFRVTDTRSRIYYTMGRVLRL